MRFTSCVFAALGALFLLQWILGVLFQMRQCFITSLKKCQKVYIADWYFVVDKSILERVERRETITNCNAQSLNLKRRKMSNSDLWALLAPVGVNAFVLANLFRYVPTLLLGNVPTRLPGNSDTLLSGNQTASLSGYISAGLSGNIDAFLFRYVATGLSGDSLAGL